MGKTIADFQPTIAGTKRVKPPRAAEPTPMTPEPLTPEEQAEIDRLLAPREYITVHEAAVYLGVKDKTIYTLLKMKTLKGYHPTGKNALRLEKGEVEAYMRGTAT